MIKVFALRLSKLCGQNSSAKFKIKETASFCVHKICGSNCISDKVPNNVHAIEEKLREKAAKILRKKKKSKKSKK